MTSEAERGGAPTDPERRHRAILRLAALDKSDFGTTLQHVLETDAAELGVERVSCWQLETDPEALHCVCGVRRSNPTLERGVRLTATEIPNYFKTIVTDPIVLADDARADPRTNELCESYLVPLGITSMMDVPIWVRGGLWGVICHEHVGPPRHWTEADRDFAVSIGHIVSMAVEARDRAEAERALRSSEFFVGILSHDLRNPLNALRLSAEHILVRTHADNASEGPVRREARRIIGTVDRMNRMVGQLLDFTRIRVGHGLPVDRTDMDLAEVSRRIIGDARTSRPDRNIALRVHGDPRGRWDPDRLWQLLSNLVSNAIEYGDDVRVEVDGEHPDNVILRVRNRGHIPPELRPHIFEPFRRRNGAPKDAGLGLGLFIAREIAHAHGGSIQLETSDEDVVFIVRLRRLGSASRPNSAPHPSALSAGHNT